MFVVVFPLGPVFCLLNNVIEIRVDAFKIVQLYRMPPPSFPTNIGIWSNVFGAISVLSVVTNLAIMLFTRFELAAGHGEFPAGASVTAIELVLGGLSEGNLLSLVGLEHLFLFLVAFVAWLLYAVPNDVLEDIYRQDYYKMKVEDLKRGQILTSAKFKERRLGPGAEAPGTTRLRSNALVAANRALPAQEGGVGLLAGVLPFVRNEAAALPPLGRPAGPPGGAGAPAPAPQAAAAKVSASALGAVRRGARAGLAPRGAAAPAEAAAGDGAGGVGVADLPSGHSHRSGGAVSPLPPPGGAPGAPPSAPAKKRVPSKMLDASFSELPPPV